MKFLKWTLILAAMIPLGAQAARLNINADHVDKFQQEKGQWYLRVLGEDGKTLASYDLTYMQKGKADVVPVGGKRPLTNPKFQVVRKSADGKSEGFSGCSGEFSGSNRIFNVSLSKQGPGVACKVNVVKDK